MAAQDFKDEVEEVQQVMAARTDRLPSRARGPTVTFGAGLTCGLAEMRTSCNDPLAVGCGARSQGGLLRRLPPQQHLPESGRCPAQNSAWSSFVSMMLVPLQRAVSGNLF